MKTILVSGASGIVGYGILRSLKKSGKDLRLIGTTIYEDSAAQGFCDVFEKAPLTNDGIYIEWLSGIILKHKIEMIIPGIEADMYKWVEHLSELEKTGTIVLMNRPELVLLCKDKWVFYKELEKLKVSYLIDTTLNNDFEFLKKKFGLPFLLKPRVGFGSKGIVRIENSGMFSNYKTEIGNNLVAQQIVGNENEEFTTSAFCDGKGSFYAHMSLRRKLSKEGFTEKAEVVDLKEIPDVIENICNYLKPVGPTNFQFRMHEGKLKLLEINPRISSATSIRSAFGYNECKMAVEYFFENKIPEQPEIRQGKAVRYTEDLIFYK